ncbi:MAG: NTP transferase domain-containing protein [Micromonosporaceae bacterium]
MIGLVLAAGAGSRLRPHTDALPKTLLPVAGELTILDIILRNLAAVGLADVAVVVGYAAAAVQARVPELERRHGVRLSLLHNDRADWNNAYSLWLARHAFAEGALLVNGDTVHPLDVEKTLLAERGPGVLIAVDGLKTLTDEAMKVRLDPSGRLLRITKQMPVADAHGEYIGAALIEARAARDLAAALEATWRRDPQLYYEDGFQLFADRTGDLRAARLGAFEWVEVDDPADLARARDIACRY